MFDRLNFVRVRLLVALMMLCGAATILAPVSQATPQAPAQAPTMIVLDASGSMANADADVLGTTRMEAAKSAARDVFASVGAAIARSDSSYTEARSRKSPTSVRLAVRTSRSSLPQGPARWRLSAKASTP